MYSSYPSCTCGLTSGRTKNPSYDSDSYDDPNADLYRSSKVGAEERYSPTVYSSIHAEDKPSENRDGSLADQAISITQLSENRLAPSLSNNSIHSNFSDDSLMCGESGAEHSCSPNNSPTSFNDLPECDKEDKSRKSYMNTPKLRDSQVPLELSPAMTAAERDATVIVNKGNAKAWWEIHDEERKRSQREQLAAQRASKLAEKRRLSFGDKVELESSFRKTSCPENTIHTGSDVEESDNSERISEQSSMTYPLAFTVDLESKRKKDFAKKLEIGDSIRQFIPRHKRTLSLPKTGDLEQEQKSDRGFEVGELPLSKTPGKGARDAQKLENDHPTETVQGVKDSVPVNIHDPVSISANQCFTESSVPVNFQVMSLKKQTCAIDNNIELKDGDMITLKCDNRSDFTAGAKVEGGKTFKNKKVIVKSSTVDVGALLHGRQDSYDASDGENVSESGTYTIEDENSHDINDARKQIEVVLGVDAENCKNILLSNPSVNNTSSKFMLSNNSFVHEWAAQVQQQHMKHISNSNGQVSGNKYDSLVGSSLKLESASQRPRRKLPTPPNKTPYCLPPVSPKSKITDKAKGVHRTGESTAKKTDPYLETECFLKDTESLVTAMQARMDISQNDDGVSLSTYYDTNESGADSDMDTSVSYSLDASASVDNKGTAKNQSSQLSKLPSKNMLPLVKSRSVGGFDSNNIRNRSHPHSASVLARNMPVTGGKSLFLDDSSLLSDSSSDFGDRAKLIKPPPTIKADPKKQGRPIWRNKLGYESDTGLASKTCYDRKKSESSSNKSCKSDTIPLVNRRKPSLPTKIEDVKAGEVFNRVDGGRFSLRAHKPAVSSNPKVPSNKPPKSNKGLTKLNRSNSSLSNKEVEFQNWKRRKEYDPMKAAAEGKKKEKKKQENAEKNEKIASEPERLTQSVHSDRRHGAKSVASSVTSNLTRSASFHGGYAAKAALTRAPVISDDDDSLSGEWSPILAAAIQSSSFLQIKSQYEQLKSSQGYSTLPANNAGHGSHGSQDAQNSNYDTEYVDCNSYLKYLSGEETNYPPGSYLGSMRNRKKLEALDTLVISTIHSLSGKLCNGAYSVLDKLRAITLDDNLLVRMETLMKQLHDLNGSSNNHPSAASPRCSTSARELATTLRNLKKLEECFNVVNMSLSELQGETES